MDIKDFCSEFNKLSQDYSMCLSKTSDRMYIMTEMGTVCSINIKDIDILTFIDEIKRYNSLYQIEDINHFLDNTFVKSEIRDNKISDILKK